MTTTSDTSDANDPRHPDHLDEAVVRGELTELFDECEELRQCPDPSPSLSALFDLIDRHDGAEAGLLSPAEQDLVVDHSSPCMLSALTCASSPVRHERSVDIRRLLLRAEAMRAANGHVTARRRRATRVLGRTDLVGNVATRIPTVANRWMGAAPNSLRRRALTFLMGVSASRRLPRFASERFSTWFEKRPRITLGKKQATVTVYPTCLVEYQATEVGRDLVRVYERNGIECHTSAARCCGAPWLHAGELQRFRKVAERNVSALAAEVKRGTDIVVPQPACGDVIRHDYVRHVGDRTRDDAELVAEHTFDAAEYLMRVHTADDTVLDTDFTGDAPDRITYHAPRRLRTRQVGFKGRDLLKLTGARVTLVQRGAGVDGIFGLRGEQDEFAVPFAERLGDDVDATPDGVVAGTCHLANTVIEARTGRRARHPIELIARAYGFPGD